jgi:predicted RecA/RadA family phage recombinase
MNKIDTPGSTADGQFTSGNPFGGIDATIVGHEWLNDIQFEDLNVILASGQSPQKGVQDQVLLAILALAESTINAAVSREVTVVAPSTLALGDFFGIEDIWGVAKAATNIGNNVVMQRCGTFSITKKAPEVFLQGQSAYWDTSASESTIDGTGSNKKLIGFVASAAGSSATAASIILTGEATPVT